MPIEGSQYPLNSWPHGSIPVNAIIGGGDFTSSVPVSSRASNDDPILWQRAQRRRATESVPDVELFSLVFAAIQAISSRRR